MKKITLLSFVALSLVIGLAAACSTAPNTTTNTTTANTTTANQAKTNAANNAATTTKPEEDTPASIKAAFPDAQSFTKQHKDIPKDAITDIEKNTGGRVPDTDHHSYLAFSTTGGARKQIGAATIVKAGGKEMVVVYENKEGSPFVKEVRADGISPDFLKQFAGKGHDDKFTYGSQIKANGVDEQAAKAIASAIAVDVMTMQNLYGASHKH